jgi:hypothetical protein
LKIKDTSNEAVGVAICLEKASRSEGRGLGKTGVDTCF